jgi:hypothetical protein
VSSSSLAFTGPGKGDVWAAWLGALLVLLGLVLLVLVSTPRRVLARLAYARTGWKLQRDQDGTKPESVSIAMHARHMNARVAVLGGALARTATRAGRWMTGR